MFAKKSKENKEDKINEIKAKLRENIKVLMEKA